MGSAWEDERRCGRGRMTDVEEMCKIEEKTVDVC